MRKELHVLKEDAIEKENRDPPIIPIIITPIPIMPILSSYTSQYWSPLQCFKYKYN